MNRFCECGGRLIPQQGNTTVAKFLCDRCGDRREQRKRQKRPIAPKLGGGIGPIEWLRSCALADRKKGAHARAAEAETIADWIEKDILR